MRKKWKQLKDLGFVKVFFLLGLLFMGTLTLVFAEGTAVPAGSSPGTTAGGGVPAVAGQPAQQPSTLGMLLPFVLMFGVVYFLMIRPQQKKMKEQQKMMDDLKSGDEVITSSGILGKVAGLAEKFVTLEIAQNVKIKVLKSQVSQVLKGPLKD